MSGRSAKRRALERWRAHAEELSDRVGYRFVDESLLLLALTHRSALEEFGSAESNERLEFLGDSVLGFVVAEHLYRDRPDDAEGRLARARSDLVDEGSLARIAGDIDLGPALLLGRGEHETGGRTKPSILADATEALIGAVALDGGVDAARTLVLDWIAPYESATVGDADPKSKLQELAAARGLGEVEYHIETSGPDHRRHFVADAEVAGRRYGPGQGTSKRSSEQAAARLAVEAIESERRSGGAER